MFNALDQVQYTGVNNTANFASLTDPTITNLPHDASGKLVRTNGFGAITGVRAPRNNRDDPECDGTIAPVMPLPGDDRRPPGRREVPD